MEQKLKEGFYPKEVIETAITYVESYHYIDDFAYELNIDARDILNALDRASFIKNEGIYIVKMEMNENEITFTLQIFAAIKCPVS